ncbi:MAG TPA: potassium transporter Kup [Casimicrobium sp.]|jgi:KUP system potassium uptake protein|nr:potassium transporter Kup [Casimicrobium sp.]
MSSHAAGSHPDKHLTGGRLAALALGAVGVVYGDIGTSPLYTLKEVFFNKAHSVALTEANVLGLLSLIFWVLTIVVSIKYAMVILRADNQGEGGTMVLLAMALRTAIGPDHAARRRWLTLLGIFGVSLFFGDSIVTPAVSVLGAMEGLKAINPALQPAVVPVTVLILVGLFYVQRTGTGKVSAFFGPIMALWFLVLGGLGIFHSASNPGVFKALSPLYAIDFLLHNPGLFLVVLGSAVLAVTGAEALYADMGHFGRKPIRVAWFAFVMPLLVINYFGQGALILKTCAGKTACEMHPFYDQVPHSFLIPMVILAGFASVIASQAVISGAFSIARQGIQLGFLPRMQVIHTSHRSEGQIYLPAVNWALFVLVLLVVISFRSTENLAAAYGLAVTGAMFIDTILFAVVAFSLWKWNKALATLAVVVFAAVDIALLASTAIKIPDGGWFPLMVASIILLLMTTWKRGRSLMAEQRRQSALPLAPMIEALARDAARVQGTAVFMTSNPDEMPAAMLHNLKHNKVLHEKNIILHVHFEDVPLVTRANRVRVEEMGHGFYKMVVNYGFMNAPDIPKALTIAAKAHQIEVEMMDTSFFVSREVLVPTACKRISIWRQRLFSVMSRNAQSATAYFQIPTNRVLELGAQIKF